MVSHIRFCVFASFILFYCCLRRSFFRYPRSRRTRYPHNSESSFSVLYFRSISNDIAYFVCTVSTQKSHHTQHFTTHTHPYTYNTNVYRWSVQNEWNEYIKTIISAAYLFLYFTFWFMILFLATRSGRNQHLRPPDPKKPHINTHLKLKHTQSVLVDVWGDRY